VEFLPYADAVRALAGHGIIARPEGDFVRFTLNPPAPARGAQDGAVRRIALAVAPGAQHGCDQLVTIPAERLCKAPEHILHRAHATEFQLIPVARWRPLLDLLAFDLAADEDWAEVDADAALHQNGRDPLGLLSRQRHLVSIIAAGILGGACGPEHDLTIAAVDSPVVIELRHGGLIVLTCVGHALADSLLSAI